MGLRLALCIVTSLLCAGIEPNPGPITTLHDNLDIKIDALADEKAVDSLDILCRNITARLALSETVTSELTSNVVLLKASVNNNALLEHYSSYC